MRMEHVRTAADRIQVRSSAISEALPESPGGPWDLLIAFRRVPAHNCIQ